jgi:hypothetical protein
MATGGLYGASPNGNVVASSGSESSGLYGNSSVFGGTYFEYLIFIESATVPATPTGGSWSFTTNIGTPPTGWSNAPPASPTNAVYLSIALVNSRGNGALTWSVPGQIYKQGAAATIAAGTTTTGAAGTSASVTNSGTSSAAVFNFTIPRGDKGDAASVAAGTTTTGAAGTSASVTNSGTSSAAVFNFTIPRGNAGVDSTVVAGTTTTGAAGTSASVTNSGTPNAAVFNFTIPRGDKGDAASVAAGTTTTGAAGTSASVTNSGTSSAAVFNFTIPRGDTGSTGPGSTVAAGTTTTTAAGTSATVTNAGTSTAAVFNFGIPRGADGVNPTVAAGTTTTGAAGTSASVTNSGTSTAAVFNFTIPRGDKGDKGDTGAGFPTGGTTGQVLSKLSNTNYDTTWSTPVVYPSSGIPNSTGSAWGTSYSTTGSGTVLALATGPSFANPTISNYQVWTSTSAPSYAEGRQWYDTTAHALAYYNDSANCIVHIGQDIQFKVINNTGSTIANGAPVYIISTSSGQTYPNIALAKADVVATSAVIGLTNGSIANGAIGYVTAAGVIDGVNTGTFTVGQTLYLSPYSAGQVMNTIPPTGLTIQIGLVTYVDSSVGKIYVKQTTPLSIPASILTGQVAIANGGTNGTSVPTAGAVPYGTGTAYAFTAAGTSGQVLTSAGAGVPVWSNAATGTVTSVAALTLGTTGTDLSSSVATGTTTPVITLNVPTASATNRGVLSSIDWTTFNNKQAALVSGTNIKTVASNSLLGSGNIAFDSLTPSQTSNAGKFLTTDGTNSSWSGISGGTF